MIKKESPVDFTSRCADRLELKYDYFKAVDEDEAFVCCDRCTLINGNQSNYTFSEDEYDKGLTKGIKTSKSINFLLSECNNCHKLNLVATTKKNESTFYFKFYGVRKQ